MKMYVILGGRSPEQNALRHAPKSGSLNQEYGSRGEDGQARHARRCDTGLGAGIDLGRESSPSNRSPKPQGLLRSGRQVSPCHVPTRQHDPGTHEDEQKAFGLSFRDDNRVRLGVHQTGRASVHREGPRCGDSDPTATTSRPCDRSAQTGESSIWRVQIRANSGFGSNCPTCALLTAGRMHSRCR